MVLKITKETWGKCDIKAMEYYNKKEDVLELWQKMRDVKIQTNHTNTDDVASTFFENETGIFTIEKLTGDIIEYCKLPKAIELRKNLGYNHDDIMIPEETSIAKKIKLFPKENIELNEKFNSRNQIFGLKIIILLLKLTKEIIKNMIQMMKKKEKSCLKVIILKFFDVIQMILISIFLNF